MSSHVLLPLLSSTLSFVFAFVSIEVFREIRVPFTHRVLRTRRETALPGV